MKLIDNEKYMLFVTSTRDELIAICSSPAAAYKILVGRFNFAAIENVTFEDWCAMCIPELIPIRLDREFYIEVHEMMLGSTTETPVLVLKNNEWVAEAS